MKKIGNFFNGIQSVQNQTKNGYLDKPHMEIHSFN